jgi:hypothetical protein
MANDPASITPGTPTIQTPCGPQPVGVPDSEAYFARFVRTADEIDTIAPLSDVNRYPAELMSASWCAGGALALSPRDACMVALYHLVIGITWQNFDLQVVVDRKIEQVAIKQLGFEHGIRLDFPEWKNEDMPVGAGLITAPDEAVWDGAGLNAEMIDGTEDVFGAGTVLRNLGMIKVPVSLIYIAAHKDQRRGLEARLSVLLAAERADDRFARRVVVHEYFRRVVELSEFKISRPDTSATAIAGRWPLEVTLEAEVELVELVYSPGHLLGTQSDVVVV